MRYRRSIFLSSTLVFFVFIGGAFATGKTPVFGGEHTQVLQISNYEDFPVNLSGKLNRSLKTTNYYPDLPINSDPVPLVRIPVPEYSMVPNSTRAFFCVLSIMYMADAHDSVTDDLLFSGQNSTSITFFCVDGAFYCIKPQGGGISFNFSTKKFGTTPLLRSLVPQFDSDAREIVVFVENSDGFDVFSGKEFTTVGTLKNQVAFVTYQDNGPQSVTPGETGDYHFLGDVVLTQDIAISADRELFFDNDTNVSGNYHAISFTPRPYPIAEVAPNSIVTFQEVVLKNFSPQNFSMDSSSSFIFGNDTVIELGKDETLTGSWCFEGSCTLKGNGQTLNLGPAGEIVVDKPGASILFDNIKITGLSGTNMRCLDETSSFSFKKTTLVLVDDFVIDKGFFYVLDELDIVGTKTLTYSTTAQSTIASNACIYVSKKGTFNYAPLSDDNKLIKMIDETSTLWLDNATLSVTTTGLRLTDGTLMVANKSFLENTGAISLSESIAIKNIDILAGGSLDIKSGILTVI